jgi:hypothetical protein
MNDFKIISYNNFDKKIFSGDFIKISIRFEECFDVINNEVKYNTCEHIWTIVDNVSDDKLKVKVSNHMFYKSISNPDYFLKDNLISINKSNIKEHKRYTQESYNNQIMVLTKIIEKLPSDLRLMIKNSNQEEREIIFEQLLNSVEFFN